MRYRTIVADPPWRYRKTSGIETNARGVNKPEAAHWYPAMATEAIAAMPVRQWCDANAHLYLWVTNPMLPVALPILTAWGFDYVTLLTWHKLGPLGMGYHFRSDTEHIIFGVRGKAPIPAGRRARNWFAAPKTGHSIKPDLFYEMVERVSPGPYLELFARRRRYGWDVWGDEAPEFAASQAEMGLLA